MKHHPEQQPDEIYMGNSTIDGVLKSSWKTSRRGEVALGSNGQFCGEGDLRPWFVKISEVENALIAAENEKQPWKEITTKAYQEMLDNRSIFKA